MKNLMKRAITFTLALSMSISLFAVPALADDETESTPTSTTPVAETTIVNETPAADTANGNQIQRPAQSETVETTPRAAQETPVAEEASTEKESSATEDASTEKETPATEDASTEKETPATEDASTEEQTSSAEETSAQKNDWSAFYNADKDAYQVTYKITEDAEGDQVIDLTKALNLLGDYAEAAYEQYAGREDALAAFLEYVKHDNRLSVRENALAYLEEQGLDTSDAYVQKYADYMVDSADYAFVRDNYSPYVLNMYYPNGNPFAPVLNNDQAKATSMMPGDVVNFGVMIESESGHTYTYKNGSFVLATPDLSGAAETGVYGFDGQELPESYQNDGLNRISYLTGDARKVANAVKDMDPAEEIDVESLLTGPIEVLVYRAQLADCAKQKESSQQYYGGGKGTPMYLRELSDKLDVDQIYALYSLSNSATAYATMTRNNAAVASYLKENGYGEGEEGYKAYLTAYYSEKDGKAYESFDQLVENSTVVQDLKRTGNGSYLSDIELPTYTEYNNFYNNLLSYVYGRDAMDALKGNDSWSNSGNALAVGDYMADMQGEQAGAWKAADQFFQELLAKGVNRNEVPQVMFDMAYNLDGFLTGNDYQLTAWAPGYNSITLEQMDGEFVLTKVDDETGETITSSEAEFQLWYLDNESTAMYCTYDADANIYTFTPAQSTVKTHEGILDVAYAMLKDIVYYLQEQVAPEGYEKDTQVYVIMDQEAFENMTEEEVSALAEAVEAESVAWLADVGSTMEDGRQGMEISFRNAKVTILPDNGRNVPKPDQPSSEDPENIVDNNVLMPEVPVSEETVSIVDEDVPMADLPIEIPAEETPVVEIPDEIVPMAEQPALDIPEAPVPMAEKPAISDDHQTVVIADELVPMADTPRTGDETHTALWAGMSLLTLAGMTVLFLEEKRRAAQESSRS